MKSCIPFQKSIENTSADENFNNFQSEQDSTQLSKNFFSNDGDLMKKLLKSWKKFRLEIAENNGSKFNKTSS